MLVAVLCGDLHRAMLLQRMHWCTRGKFDPADPWLTWLPRWQRECAVASTDVALVLLVSAGLGWWGQPSSPGHGNGCCV